MLPDVCCEYIQPSIFFEPLCPSTQSLFIAAWLIFVVKMPTERQAQHFLLFIYGWEREFDVNIASFKLCQHNVKVLVWLEKLWPFLCLNMKNTQNYYYFFLPIFSLNVNFNIVSEQTSVKCSNADKSRTKRSPLKVCSVSWCPDLPLYSICLGFSVYIHWLVVYVSRIEKSCFDKSEVDKKLKYSFHCYRRWRKPFVHIYPFFWFQWSNLPLLIILCQLLTE